MAVMYNAALTCASTKQYFQKSHRPFSFLSIIEKCFVLGVVGNFLQETTLI